MNGYKIDFETPNGDPMPHWDEAKNIAFDNTGTHIVSETVQNAIAELAEKSDRIMLSAIPGFENIDTSPISLDTPELPLREYIYLISDTAIDWSSELEGNGINPRFWLLGKQYYTKTLTELENMTEITSRYYVYKVGEYLYYPILGDNFSDCANAVFTNNGLFVGIPFSDITQAMRDDSGHTVRAGVNAILLSQQDNWQSSLPLASDFSNKYVYVSIRDYNPIECYFNEYKRPVQIQDYDDLSNYTPEDVDSTVVINNMLSRFYSDHEAEYTRAANTRAFLMSVLGNTALSEKTIVFPKDATFLISYALHTNINTTKYFGLCIEQRISIDLNGSTIQGMSNEYTESSVICFSDEADGSKLENGTIYSDRDAHIQVPLGKAKDEHCSVILLYCKARLYNLHIANAIGDGIGFVTIKGGYAKFVLPATFTNGSLDTATGTVSSAAANSGKWVTDFIALDTLITGYTTKHPDWEIMPYPNLNSVSNIESLPFSIEPHYVVAFYSSANESSFIKATTNYWTESLPTPAGTVYIRLAFVCDGTVAKANLFKLGINGIDWRNFTEIEKCEIYNCGRNGIVPAAIKKTVISKCFIHDIGGTSNNVGIDVESDSALDGDMELSDSVLEPMYGAAIISSTGRRLTVRDCDSFGTLEFRKPDVVIDRCHCRKAVIFKEFPSVDSIGPKRRISNSTLDSYISAYDAIIDNCIIKGNTGALANQTIKSNRVQSKFRNCVINGNVFPGQYENCVFDKPSELKLQGYSENSVYKGDFSFKNCTFRCAHIQPLYDADSHVYNVSFVGCTFNLSKVSGKVIYGLYIKDFTDNIVIADRTSGTTNSTPLCSFKLTNQTVIARNVFKSSNSAMQGTLIGLNCIRAITDNINVAEFTRNTFYCNGNSTMVVLENVGAGVSTKIESSNNNIIQSSVSNINVTDYNTTSVTSGSGIGIKDSDNVYNVNGTITNNDDYIIQ